MIKQTLAFSLLAACLGLAFAKLPVPDDAAKAKAAEAAAKAAWQAKVDAYQLCKAQDRVVVAFMKGAGKNDGKPAAAPAAGAASAAASSAPPPCADPGPFAYNPPQQKPLEASGAHSPAGTAANPPSGRTEAAQMPPAEKK